MLFHFHNLYSFKEALFFICNFEKFTLSIFNVLKFFFYIKAKLKGLIDNWETRYFSCV